MAFDDHFENLDATFATLTNIVRKFERSFKKRELENEIMRTALETIYAQTSDEWAAGIANVALNKNDKNAAIEVVVLNRKKKKSADVTQG